MSSVSFKSYFRKINGNLWYYVKAIPTAKNKKMKNRHIIVYKENMNGFSLCRNLYYSNFRKTFYSNIPGDKRSVFSTLHTEEWSECYIQDLHAYNPMSEKDEKILLELYPSFKYAYRKIKKCFSSYENGELTVKDTFKYLKIWLNHNEIEFFAMTGFYNILDCKSLYNFTETRKKAFFNFLMKDCSDLKKSTDLKYLNFLFSNRQYVVKPDYQDFIDFVKYTQIYSVDIFYYLLKQKKKSNAQSLFDVAQTYKDYMKMAKLLEKNVTERYWTHPSDLNKRHAKILEQLERKREYERIIYQQKRDMENMKQKIKAEVKEQKLNSYLKEHEIPKTVYLEYFKDLTYTHKKLTESLVYPKNFEKTRNRIEQEVKDKKIMLENERQKALRKKYQDYYKAVKNFLSYQENVDGYEIFIPESIDEFEKQAQVLGQCLLTCDFPRQVINKSCILVFIQKDGEPIATAQILKDGTIGQFHADQHSHDNYYPSEEVKTAFNKWFTDKEFKLAA